MIRNNYRFLMGRRGDNKIPDAIKFWMRVDTSGDCWIWEGARHKEANGEYGTFWVGGKPGHSVNAHN